MTIHGCPAMRSYLLGRKNAVRGSFGVSRLDNTDPTTPGSWYSTLEGRYTPMCRAGAFAA